MQNSEGREEIALSGYNSTSKSVLRKSSNDTHPVPPVCEVLLNSQEKQI